MSPNSIKDKIQVSGPILLVVSVQFPGGDWSGDIFLLSSWNVLSSFSKVDRS